MEWIEETLHPNFRFRVKVDKLLFEEKTGHQHLVIIENGDFGRMMYLDGVCQVSERDEFIYHEMLAHLPILAHGAAKKVLIVGGGDGGMLEEVLKHAGVEKVTMVEIDSTVVDLAKEHFRSICGQAFEDPRCELVFADGRDFVRETAERYDVAIIDSTDPIGPGEVLFTETFYRDAKGALAEGGILVTQNGAPFVQGQVLAQSIGIFKRLFADATCYLATVPTYSGGPMAFGWGCDDPAKRATPVETLRERYKAAGLETRYYSPEGHAAAFALPPYISALFED